MVRPCVCDRVTSEVYDLSQCRLCWLYRYNAAYRQLWDNTDFPGRVTPSQPPGRLADCVHLGRVLDRRGRSCAGCWVRECEVHGRCTVNRETVEGVPSCQGCADYRSERTPEEKRPAP